ncbi:MAG: hypothetical protein KC486_29100, partial [Myxococcales bacterium]|nr:hypothetical protein [Myxococcales bacterium]
VAVGCAGGQPFRIDCAAAGKRCVMTGEGATCRAPSADDCAAGSPPSCVDDVLRYCHDGRWASLDCSSQGASCDADSGRCVQVVAAGEGDCGACGCPTGPSGDEVCDGRDNDGDGEIDEDITCAPVPLIFFVVGDRPGTSREELEAQVARLDRTFAGDPEGAALGLRFTILDVVRLDVPAWVDPDEAAWAQMAQSERLHPKRDDFYIPIAMVGSIATGDVPKAGVATIPNGTCGGQRRGAANQIGVGLVMVADRRSPTTLAHEIGHFLGLCHTHADDADVTQRVVVDADGEPLDCAEACTSTGDGVCDTPADPGVESCAVDRACEVTCPGDQRPDPRNIMSYYTWCRRQFTAEQLALVRTSLWLRRGWHRCLRGLPDETCTCTPALRECPEAMSCWPHSGGDSCWLDGPLPPGAGPCTQHLECSLGALCIADPSASTCVRPCLLSQPGCTCVDVGLEHRMCKEDLGARAR